MEKKHIFKFFSFVSIKSLKTRNYKGITTFIRNSLEKNWNQVRIWLDFVLERKGHSDVESRDRSCLTGGNVKHIGLRICSVLQ